MARHFGHIPGTTVGQTFEDRKALAASGIHKPTMAGISGSKDEGADSIVVSGGYVDNADNGDEINYIGDGGNDPSTKQQIADQTLTGRNLALAISADQGLPVRVTRGSQGKSVHAPTTGYRYDGLYQVESYWPDTGQDGYRIYRYRLLKQPEPAPADTQPEPNGTPAPAGNPTPSKTTTSVHRTIRSTATAQWVKQIHHHRCQICQTTLETPSGRYAEGAHIRPLGNPHNGPDTTDNILCLCPNCHILFDRHAIYIDEENTVRTAAEDLKISTLNEADGHKLDPDHVRHHRDRRNS